MLLSLRGNTPHAVLALADGTVYIGNSIGAAGFTVGEVVFNTSMTGYQEILTDPSYCQQIVTLTYPHIGNYGTNPEDVESGKVQVAGFIIKDLPLVASNFRSTQSLGPYLVAEGIVAIANIDTRQLTRQLRTQGAQNGCILALAPGQNVNEEIIAKAVAAAKAAPKKAPVSKTAKAVAKISASIAKLTERKNKINADIQTLRGQRAALKTAPAAAPAAAPVKAKPAAKPVAKAAAKPCHNPITSPRPRNDSPEMTTPK